MNPPSMDIRDLIAAGGLGLVVMTNLFIGQEPDKPANTVTVFDTPGMPPMLSLDRLETYEFPTVQIRIRNTSYAAGYAMAYDIKELLHGLAHVTQGGATYELIKCQQDPFLLDYDESNRPRFVMNLELQRK